MEKALIVENVGKMYRLGTVGTGTLSHDLNRFWHKIRGKEDPYTKVGQENNRAAASDNPYVWALKDINFTVDKGEVLGIIGKNGAGKSTLLKILSKITSPTTGSIKVNGRIASLLEVGTGFHPELTGRENIYLNGAILGMKRHEIKAKFDEIVEFSGCERYLDTPVKRYSSGMYVRLAFAVAAHLESEILIVDEVLAVGDAEFQKKCLGKMKDVSNKEGRTVLFVSHNMTAIENLCTNSILIANGTLNSKDKTSEIIKKYLQFSNSSSNKLSEIKDRSGNQNVKFNSAVIKNQFGEDFKIEAFKDTFIELDLNSNIKLSETKVEIGIINDIGTRVAWLSSSLMSNLSNEPRSKITFQIKDLNLVPGQYSLNLYCQTGTEINDWLIGVSPFEILDKNYFNSGKTIDIKLASVMLNFEII